MGLPHNVLFKDGVLAFRWFCPDRSVLAATQRHLRPEVYEYLMDELERAFRASPRKLYGKIPFPNGAEFLAPATAGRASDLIIRLPDGGPDITVWKDIEWDWRKDAILEIQDQGLPFDAPLEWEFSISHGVTALTGVPMVAITVDEQEEMERGACNRLLDLAHLPRSVTVHVYEPIVADIVNPRLPDHHPLRQCWLREGQFAFRSDAIHRLNQAASDFMQDYARALEAMVPRS